MKKKQNYVKNNSSEFLEVKILSEIQNIGLYTAEQKINDMEIDLRKVPRMHYRDL